MPAELRRPLDRRVPAAVAGLLLLVAMLFLLFHGPRFVADPGEDDEVAVICGSVLTVGWPSDGSFVDSENSRSYGDHVTRGRPTFVALEGIARDCSERRDTYLGLLVLLAVPASVCLSVAAGSRRELVGSGQPPAV